MYTYIHGQNTQNSLELFGGEYALEVAVHVFRNTLVVLITLLALIQGVS